MSCEYCEDLNKNNIIESKLNSMKAADDIYDVDVPTNFCPNCGRPLNEQEPLSLEELREMENEPVWTVTKGVNGSGKWELLSWHIIRICPLYEGIMTTNLLNYSDTPDIYQLDTYGKTWLAYKHKPKEI